MTRRISEKAVYVATILAMLGLVGGYALATISVTASTQNGIANYVSAGGSITGFTYSSTQLKAVGTPAPSASTGTATAPQSLIAVLDAYCANTCTTGDLAEIVTYSFTTSFSGAVQIALQVTASSGGGSATIYLAQATIAVTGSITITWDLGATTSTITSVSATAQQCSSSTTCP